MSGSRIKKANYMLCYNKYYKLTFYKKIQGANIWKTSVSNYLYYQFSPKSFSRLLKRHWYKVELYWKKYHLNIKYQIEAISEKMIKKLQFSKRKRLINIKSLKREIFLLQKPHMIARNVLLGNMHIWVPNKIGTFREKWYI